jgi:hypothetical protein
VKEKWEDNDVWTQALILAYNQVRDYDETEEKKAILGNNTKKPAVRGRRRRRR